MYDLTDIEYERYNKCYLFRKACEYGFGNGFSKEEMLSKLLMHMLEAKDAEDKRKLDEIMYSLKPGMIISDFK
ncbi:hypothetical protein [Vibrio phage vB_VviC_ZQ26]|nr:hypothetical protein [Vibrio phage vB_VviC_ZQ26]